MEFKVHDPEENIKNTDLPLKEIFHSGIRPAV